MATIRPTRLHPVRLAGIVSVLLLADLVTKLLASRVDGWSFVHSVRNENLLLSLAGPDAFIVLALSAVALIVGFVYAVRLAGRGLVAWWIVALGAAGGLGNLIDRVLFGGVRDWLVIGPTRWNLADFFLLVAIPAVLIAGISSMRTESSVRSINQRREVNEQ